MDNKNMTARQRQELAEKQQKKQMLIVGIVAAVIVVAVLIVGGIAIAKQIAIDKAEALKKGDGATLETAKATHIATIEIEGYGTIKAELYGKTAPTSVNNFVELANKGFYTGLTFHRIMEGFMMQGGAPKGDGTGGNEDARGNEINIFGEFTANGFENNLLHKKGVLSMARGNDMDSASSQFFIMHEDYPSLDGKYAAFGMVIEGQDIVDKICTEAEPTDSNGTIPRDAQPVIRSITIVEVE